VRHVAASPGSGPTVATAASVAKLLGLSYTGHVTIEELQDRLATFAAQRDWEQFHTPKNLAMALAGEVGELLAHFQWLTAEESRQVMSGPREQELLSEFADVFSYLLRLADVLDVDLTAAVLVKLDRNEERYPVELARGNARKYDQLAES
jgi:dCTP diphosphatase